MVKQDNIILDTSVLIKLNHKLTRIVVAKALESLNAGYYISWTICYEFTRNASDHESFIRNYDFLKQFKYLPITLETMKVATFYYNAIKNLKKVGENKGKPVFHNLQNFDDADIIIGATAIQTKAMLMTFNFCDFPVPFFREEDRFMIGEEIMYLLKPDIRAFEKAILKIKRGKEK
ncbi:hypothetical protein KJ652_01265 [Patescibacteria group bacterium]|nr:hypothetical protein [Patescibacteria group bacterium]MBU1123200.1 hypothetical protein [Patescibacteria group bacterium]MBU1911798.1 hypothetical protein [Patescibacteria group bacterium]